MRILDGKMRLNACGDADGLRLVDLACYRLETIAHEPGEIRYLNVGKLQSAWIDVGSERRRSGPSWRGRRVGSNLPRLTARATTEHACSTFLSSTAMPMLFILLHSDYRPSV